MHMLWEWFLHSHCCVIHSTDDHSAVSRWGLWWIICCKHCYLCLWYNISVIYLGENVSRVDTASFPKGWYQFLLPAAIQESFSFSTSSPTPLSVVSFYHFGGQNDLSKLYILWSLSYVQILTNSPKILLENFQTYRKAENIVQWAPICDTITWSNHVINILSFFHMSNHLSIHPSINYLFLIVVLLYEGPIYIPSHSPVLSRHLMS